MRTALFGATLLASTAVVVVLTACGKKDEQPQAVAPSAQPSGYPPPGYGQPYPQQPGYPPPGQTAPPPTATAPAPTATGGMSAPGPAALACQNDSTCGLHRCNTQYSKCTFPCQNAEFDCVAGNQCVLGLCVPKPPGQ